jgi:Phage minor structural protein GP20
VSLIRLFARRCMSPEGDPAAGGGAGGSGSKPETFSREYVHELREENRSWRTKHQESENARKVAEDSAKAAEKTSGDKVKDVQTVADQRVIRAELKAAAVKAGMVDLDGLKLADFSKVKLNDQGEVEGADELMASMKKSKPYLFGQPSTSSSHQAPKPGENKPKKVSEMTDAERKAEAQARGFSGF